MILIGQYDSPFVRRVGIALTLYDIPFEHRPWSAFGDADRLRAINPLTRVPTLVLEDGTVLVDSYAMLDQLDRQVGPERALWPMDEPARRQAVAVAGLATGLADKAVCLFYELRLHDIPSDLFVARCRAQIGATAATLEADRAARPGAYWFGDRLTHADIAVAVALRFLGEAHPRLIDTAAHPALAAHAARMEALAVFRRIGQKFIPPA